MLYVIFTYSMFRNAMPFSIMDSACVLLQGLHNLFHHGAVQKRITHSVNLLIILMSLTDDGNHISLLGMGDAVGNGFLPVRDFDEFSAGFLDAAADIRNDILHLLKAGVVCGDDGLTAVF